MVGDQEAISTGSGRPAIAPDKVALLRETYLGLLRLGKTEIEINAVKGMVCWDTRYRWLADAEFSARRLHADTNASVGTSLEVSERTAAASDCHFRPVPLFS